MSRAWTHWGTSRHFETLRLPVHDAGTRLEGAPLGRALRGGDFVLDPFDAYRAGVVTNPNVVVAGAIGSGKSTLVKMMIERALRRGRHVVVVDPKGEYGAMARLHETSPLVIGRDGWCWPSLDPRGVRDFVTALLASAKGTALGDEELYVLDRTLAAVESPAPRSPLAALFAQLSPYLVDPARGPERSLALTLRRFIEGDLRGLFDGEGPPMDLGGPLVVLDVSHFWGTSALGVAALSAVAATEHLAGSAAPGYLVLDEAWALLGDEASLRWLQGSWKLARSRGVCHVLVLHRWSDVAAVGDAGSAQRGRARGLLRECELTWLFRQPPDEATELVSVLGLHPREQAWLAGLERGAALVRYGSARSLVRVTPTTRDVDFVDSDAAMRSRRV